MIQLRLRFFTLVLLVAAMTVSVSIQPAMASQAVASKAPATTIATADKLDINTATPDQLKALKGIGDAYSKRIIDGRPYTAKNQLSTRGILPPATYNQIKDLIIAKAPKK